MSAAGRFFKGALARTFGVVAGVGTGLGLAISGAITFDSYRDFLNARGDTGIVDAYAPVFAAIAVGIPVSLWLSRKVGRIVETTMMDWLLPPQPPKPPAPKP